MQGYLLLLSGLIAVEWCKSQSYFHEEKVSPVLLQDPDGVHFAEVIEKAIQRIENNAVTIEKQRSEHIPPPKEIDDYYNEAVESFRELAEIISEPEHAYKFLKANGVERIILPHMEVYNSKLRATVLLTLKTLFEVAPTITDASIPVTTLDKLLEIFENDDNLAMKAHALDILYIWLPENPRMQVRVMKLKGLEPFYKQIAKLDTSVISVLLDLFNKILEEHIRVRNDRSQRGKMGSDELILYQRIGLVERMSTPQVCNGLLNIFIMTWSYTNDDNENDIIVPIFELIKNIKPYCVKVFKRKTEAVEVFEALLKFASDESKRDYFNELGLNVTDVSLVLTGLVEELRRPPVKEEF